MNLRISVLMSTPCARLSRSSVLFAASISGSDRNGPRALALVIIHLPLAHATPSQIGRWPPTYGQ